MNTDETVVETFEAEEEANEPTEEQVAAMAANLKLEADGGDGDTAAPAAAPAEEKIPRYIAVQVKPDQYNAIKAFANGKALSGFVLGLLADVVPNLKVEVATTNARQKYATKEEAKKAAAERRKDRNELIKQLLEEHAKRQAAAAKAAS